MFSLRFFTIIPEKSAYIIERFGKFHEIKSPGWNWLVPVLDRIAYK
jgi:regulator of protease activity HflC (stomatin/prohibitin superfamily)